MTATTSGPRRIWWAVSIPHDLQYLIVFGSASCKDAGSGQDFIFPIRPSLWLYSTDPPIARILVRYWNPIGMICPKSLRGSKAGTLFGGLTALRGSESLCYYQ